MNKPPFIEALEEKLRPEERIFKFRTAELCGDSFKLELLVDHANYDNILDEALEKKVRQITSEIIPQSFKSYVCFVKASNEENSIKKHVLEYIYKEKPTVYNGFLSAPMDVTNNMVVISIAITLEKYLFEYAVNSGLKKDLEAYLSQWIIEDCEVNFIEVPNSEENQKVITRPQVAVKTMRTIRVEIEDYYNGTLAQEPRYIADVKDGEVSQVCLCGAISKINARYIEKIDKTLYSFNLNDTTSVIKVKYFAKKLKNVDWEKVFVDGKTLIMQGQIKFDSFDSAFAFFPRTIAGGTIDFGSVNLKSDFLPEPKDYIHITPKPISDGVQANMLGGEMNRDLTNNIYVVFDVETTGLDATRDQIIEIGAVKLINGEICESFSCFVNPKIALPEEIVKLTHITDDMLTDAYTMEEIIGDFYKFTRGSILVAHNANFDMGFLGVAGKKHRYDFDNSFMDTLAMARQKLKLRSNKLENLCEYFKITNAGAHRAIHDALATAKIFIELMNR